MAKRFAVVCFVILFSLAPFTFAQKTPDATDAVVSAEDDNGDVKLKRPEQIALMFVVTIASLEDDCQRHAQHACTLDELIAGPKSKDNWSIGKLKFDPNKSDPNYEYKVTLNGEKWQVWANPKKAGLGGFYFMKRGFFADKFFNPAGVADEKSTKLSGYSISGDSFKS